MFFLLLLSFFPLLSTCVFFLFPRLGCSSFDLLVLICRRDLQSLALVVLGRCLRQKKKKRRQSLALSGRFCFFLFFFISSLFPQRDCAAFPGDGCGFGKRKRCIGEESLGVGSGASRVTVTPTVGGAARAPPGGGSARWKKQHKFQRENQ